MTKDEEAQSGRAGERGAAKARKMAKLAWSQNSFDLLASGYTPTDCGSPSQHSDDPARDRSAIARRRLDAPERYVHLQVARLTKALRFADAALERGDLKAVRALVEVVAAMDRYHGLSDTFRDRASPGLPGPLELHAPAAALAASQAVPCGFASRRGPGGIGGTDSFRRLSD